MHQTTRVSFERLTKSGNQSSQHVIRLWQDWMAASERILQHSSGWYEPYGKLLRFEGFEVWISMSIKSRVIRSDFSSSEARSGEIFSGSTISNGGFHFVNAHVFLKSILFDQHLLYRRYIIYRNRHAKIPSHSCESSWWQVCALMRSWKCKKKKKYRGHRE